MFNVFPIALLGALTTQLTGENFPTRYPCHAVDSSLTSSTAVGEKWFGGVSPFLMLICWNLLLMFIGRSVMLLRAGKEGVAGEEVYLGCKPTRERRISLAGGRWRGVKGQKHTT